MALTVYCKVCDYKADGLLDYESHMRAHERPRHTVNGKTTETGWPYGTTHDYDCPACVASGSSFTASPRSETYWCS